MQENPFTANIAVLNQGAGGNRILYDGLGPNALGRIDRDVLAQSGIRYAMIFEGVNDIGTAATDVYSQQVVGDRLIQAFEQIVTHVHAFGIPMFAATITPNDTSQPYADAQREVTRQRVNAWIRDSGTFDAVVDFDAIVRDAAEPCVQLGRLFAPERRGLHRDCERVSARNLPGVCVRRERIPVNRGWSLILSGICDVDKMKDIGMTGVTINDARSPHGATMGWASPEYVSGVSHVLVKRGYLHTSLSGAMSNRDRADST